MLTNNYLFQMPRRSVPKLQDDWMPSFETVLVKTKKNGSIDLFHKVTGHKLQSLPPQRISNCVTIRSDNAQEITPSLESQLIQDIVESSREIAVVVPFVDIQPDPQRVAMELTRQSQLRRRGMSSFGSSSSKSSSGPILRSDSGSSKSTTTTSWSPFENDSLQGERKAAERAVSAGTLLSRLQPGREGKTQGAKKRKRRHKRQYDFGLKPAKKRRVQQRSSSRHATQKDKTKYVAESSSEEQDHDDTSEDRSETSAPRSNRRKKSSIKQHSEDSEEDTQSTASKRPQRMRGLLLQFTDFVTSSLPSKSPATTSSTKKGKRKSRK